MPMCVCVCVCASGLVGIYVCVCMYTNGIKTFSVTDTHQPPQSSTEILRPFSFLATISSTGRPTETTRAIDGYTWNTSTYKILNTM